MEKLIETIRAHRPELALVLGSGWGTALQMDRVILRVPYSEIPALGTTTVVGHAGELIVYSYAGKNVLAFCGRRHYYEGLGWGPVIAPIEIMRQVGIRKVLLTNAAGGINISCPPGSLMLIADHINTSGVNPLIGPHNENYGPRFPDMTAVYSPALRALLQTAAAQCSHAAPHTPTNALTTGVYAFTTGPCYETPAEIRAYRAQGADCVGMSTVPEAIVAHACGMEVAALSLISNFAAGISPTPLDHREVMAAATAAQPRMSALISAFIPLI